MLLCLLKVLGTTLSARTGTDDCFPGSLDLQLSASPYLCYQLSAVEDTAGGLVLAKGSLESVDPYVGGPP